MLGTARFDRPPSKRAATDVVVATGRVTLREAASSIEMVTNNFDSALPFLESLSIFELLRVHRWTLHRLVELGVVRSLNAPQGDWAETLVTEAYNGELVKKSGAARDVIAEDGSSLQVKSRVVDPTKKGSNKTSSIRSWDFDKLVAVILNTDDLRVEKATEFIGKKVENRAYYHEHVHGESLVLNAILMSQGTDVTKKLQAAETVVNHRCSI